MKKNIFNCEVNKNDYITISKFDDCLNLAFNVSLECDDNVMIKYDDIDEIVKLLLDIKSKIKDEYK